MYEHPESTLDSYRSLFVQKESSPIATFTFRVLAIADLRLSAVRTLHPSSFVAECGHRRSYRFVAAFGYDLSIKIYQFRKLNHFLSVKTAVPSLPTGITRRPETQEEYTIG